MTRPAPLPITPTAGWLSPFALRGGLARILRRHVHQLGVARVAEARVVVEGHLAVDSHGHGGWETSRLTSTRINVLIAVDGPQVSRTGAMYAVFCQNRFHGDGGRPRRRAATGSKAREYQAFLREVSMSMPSRGASPGGMVRKRSGSK